MYRKIFENLIEWKNSESRKPLILQGARQVGKTYAVTLFGQNNYANTVYCNFEKEGSLKDFFNDLTPKEIIKKLSCLKRKEIIPGHTLIVFDEIQACPQALTSLKYFQEEANDYHVIATGSLLGVSVHRGEHSFPVGKVDFLTMHPMDFEEFLIATNNAFLTEQIKEHFLTDTRLDEPFHKKALELYKTYLYVGGMPEVVDEYTKNANFDLVKIKQQSVLDAYFNDMGKYNKESEIPKTRLVYKNISVQLARENKKFKYSAIKSGGRSAEFESAIEWLCLAGIANQLYRVEQIKLPLNAYRSLSDFKFFMNDVGLCSASQDLLPEDLLSNNSDLNDFKGGLTENYVNNQLLINNLIPYYWTGDNQSEIDFIIRLNGDIIPVEVKSDDNVKSKSLNFYVKKYQPTYAIRISAKNFGFENGIKSIPLYAAFCLKQQK